MRRDEAFNPVPRCGRHGPRTGGEALTPLLLLAGGIVLLVLGAEALVRGASRLALAAGLSRLMVGLIVVAIGTSAPEAAITVGAAWQGRSDLAVGNVVGSNVFNVLFILGVSALLVPLAVGRRLVRLDVPIMLGMSLLFILMALDGAVERWESLLLLVLAAGYIAMNLHLGRQEPEPDSGATVRGAQPLALAAVLAVVGVVLLVGGARLTVDGASAMARSFGISDLVIGLTVVAAGTSLPEVATSVLAAVRGERDIAIGNIVGSCILNIAFVLGLAGALAPAALAVAPGVLSFDLPVMAAAAAAVLPIAFTRQIIARWEGGLFLAFYGAYVTHLVLTATQHPAAHELGYAFRWFVLPLTLIVLGAALWRDMRRRARRPVS